MVWADGNGAQGWWTWSVALGNGRTTRRWAVPLLQPPTSAPLLPTPLPLPGAVAYKRQGLTAPAPRGLATTPKQYQLSGLQWMLNREAKVRGGTLSFRHTAWLHDNWSGCMTDGTCRAAHCRTFAQLLSPTFTHLSTATSFNPVHQPAGRCTGARPAAPAPRLAAAGGRGRQDSVPAPPAVSWAGQRGGKHGGGLFV